MLNPLSFLKQRTKARIASFKSNAPSCERKSLSQQRKEELDNQIKTASQEKRRLKLEKMREGDEVLPPAEVDSSITKEINNQMTDSWARLISEFKRQIENSNDLRMVIGDQVVVEEQPEDHKTVKFFKGVLNEWRYRLFSLPDQELATKKDELTMLWYCYFALQPLFNGLNKHELGTNISAETEEIANHLRKLEFKEANDHYNNLAIGNNIWPIGITQYSIHWKFSLDLIDSDRILHLFNSEPARNAIISIKRLMTKYEEFHKKMTVFK